MPANRPALYKTARDHCVFDARCDSAAQRSTHPSVAPACPNTNAFALSSRSQGCICARTRVGRASRQHCPMGQAAVTAAASA
jgi:hypothetical protein